MSSDIIVVQQNDTTISVSSSGPQGPTGPAGATGATGATGPQGPAGPSGGYAYDTPSQHNMYEYNFIPQLATVSNNFTSGRIYGVSFIAQSSSTTNNVSAGVLSAASTPFGGQNLIGLYAVSGTTATQVAITGDLGTWGSQGFNSYAWSAPYTLVPGTTYLVLLMSNASGPVHLAGLSATSGFPAMYNANCNNIAAPWYKFFVQTPSGATALPASFTINATTMSVSLALTPWVGLL